MKVLLLLALCNALSLHEFTERSWKLCVDFHPCKDTFRLSGIFLQDKDRFARQLAIVMENNKLTQLDALQSDALFVRVMVSYRMCGLNEVYDPLVGCTCRADKFCREMLPSEMSISQVALSLAVLLGIAFVYWFGSKTLSKQAEIIRKSLRL